MKFIMYMLLSSIVAFSNSGNISTAKNLKILVILDKYKLYLYNDNGFYKEYNVAVGAEQSPTPTGDFKVISKLKNPWYTPYKEKIAIPPGDEENPLGTHWIGLNKKHYGIHGTNDPDSIGKAASAGCIRMKNEDVKELFSLIHTGAEVKIINTGSLSLYQEEGKILN